MPDYVELLARLGEPWEVGIAYSDAEWRIINAERAECAAAIRALLAARDAAALSEREACANVCDVRRRWHGKTRPATLMSTYKYEEAAVCARKIRERGRAGTNDA